MQMGIQLVSQRPFFPVSMIRRSPRLRRLGALTPTQAAQQVMPTISGRAGFTQKVFNYIVGDVTRGSILNYSGANPGDCAKAGNASSIKGALTKTGSGIALKLVAAGTVTGPAAPFVIAAGVIAGLFSAIFNHHAMAVAREQGTLCAAVPAANAAIGAIDGAVQTGQISPAVGAASMQQILQEFTSTVAPIAKDCNAACVMTKDVGAIVAYKVSQYNDMSAAQAAAAAKAAAQQAKQAGATPAVAAAAGVAASNVVTSLSTSLGVPSWGVYAAAGLLLFMLVKR